MWGQDNQNFNARSLSEKAKAIDINKDGQITSEELQGQKSKYLLETFVDQLRAGAKKENLSKEEIDLLRSTINSLQSLNDLREDQKNEIESITEGALAGLFDVIKDTREKITTLKGTLSFNQVDYAIAMALPPTKPIVAKPLPEDKVSAPSLVEKGKENPQAVAESNDTGMKKSPAKNNKPEASKSEHTVLSGFL